MPERFEKADPLLYSTLRRNGAGSGRETATGTARGLGLVGQTTVQDLQMTDWVGTATLTPVVQVNSPY